MAPPGVPSNLQGSFNPDNTITLTWSDNATTEDGYRVFESSDAGNSFMDISGDLPADTESFTTGQRDRDLGYVYYVEAFNVDGTSQSEETTVIDEGYAVDDRMERFTEESTPAPPNAVEDGTDGGPIDKETGYLVDEGMDRLTEAVPQAVPSGAAGGAGGGPIEVETGYLVDERMGRFSSWPPDDEQGQQEPTELAAVAGGLSAGEAASFGLVPGLSASGGGRPGSIVAGFRG